MALRARSSTHWNSFRATNPSRRAGLFFILAAFRKIDAHLLHAPERPHLWLHYVLTGGFNAPVAFLFTSKWLRRFLCEAFVVSLGAWIQHAPGTGNLVTI